jgi:hypothetical protein
MDQTLYNTSVSVGAPLLGDPVPFDFEGFVNTWNAGQPTEKAATNRDGISKVMATVSQPFLAKGYVAGAAVNRGLAALATHFDNLSTYIELSTGMKSEGLFEKIAENYEQYSDYWQKRAEQVGVNFFDEIVGEAVGGAVPGITQFSLDVASLLTFPYMDGAVEGYKKNESPFANGMLEAAKTGTLAGIFKAISPLKQYLRAPIMGTVFGVQGMEGAAEGDKTKQFVKDFAIGAGYSMTSPGGRMGLNEAAKNAEPAIQDFVNKMKEERGSVDLTKKSDLWDLEPGITRIKSTAIKMKDGRIFTGKHHDEAYEQVPYEQRKPEFIEEYDGFLTTKGEFITRKEAVARLPKDDTIGKFTQDAADLVNHRIEYPSEQGQKRQRKYLKTVEEAAETEPELAEKLKEVDPQDYLVQPNAESLAKAKTRIDTDGVDEAVKYVQSDASLNAEKGATFISLMDKFQREGDLERAVDMVEAYDTQLREAGRFVQAASLWSKSTPYAFIKWANRQLEAVRNNYTWADTLIDRKPESFTLSRDEQKTIIEKFREMNEMTDAKDKADATLGLIDMVAKKVPPSVSEMIDAYRMQNMLASPKTQMRNIHGNSVNTFLTRPIDIVSLGAVDYIKAGLTGKERQAYISDVPVYMKAAINSIPNAVKTFVNTVKLGADASIGKPEIGIEAKTEFQKARTKQMPTALTLTQRFMEATDKFFSAIIGAGEMARLKKQGMNDADAYKKASEVAEEYLYREQLSKEGKQLSIPSEVLNSLGNMIDFARKTPVLGTLSKWYVPFLRTPVNVAIQMVEHSPLGAIRTNASSEALARVLSGSVVTALGGIMAFEGETTWSPPTDPDEKSWYYATGRKPYSVKVGDKWIPLWYLGPFALAFGLPAALKYYIQDEKKASTSDGVEKTFAIVNGLSKFIASQSSTQNIGALFSTLQGDIDFKFSSQTAFTVGQMIPAESFVRYINTMIDPVYRKPKGFVENLESNIPILSQRLEARQTPLLEDSVRENVNYFLPYDIGVVKPNYENLFPYMTYQARQNYLKNKMETLIQSYKNGDVDYEKGFENYQKLIDAIPKNLDLLQESK